MRNDRSPFQVRWRRSLSVGVLRSECSIQSVQLHCVSVFDSQPVNCNLRDTSYLYSLFLYTQGLLIFWKAKLVSINILDIIFMFVNLFWMLYCINLFLNVGAVQYCS